jgi:hypothetical protein
MTGMSRKLFFYAIRTISVQLRGLGPVMHRSAAQPLLHLPRSLLQIVAQ